MTTINAKQARKQLGELIDAAEGGETIVITRRGRKVAELGPVRTRARRKLPDLAAFRASVGIMGKPLSEAVVAARAKERY